jgi:hypothetical protein
VECGFEEEKAEGTRQQAVIREVFLLPTALRLSAFCLSQSAIRNLFVLQMGSCVIFQWLVRDCSSSGKPESKVC